MLFNFKSVHVVFVKFHHLQSTALLINAVPSADSSDNSHTLGVDTKYLCRPKPWVELIERAKKGSLLAYCCGGSSVEIALPSRFRSLNLYTGDC